MSDAMNEPEFCEDHPHVKVVKFCPACRGSVGGGRRSAAQRATAKQNIVKAYTDPKAGRPKKAR